MSKFKITLDRKGCYGLVSFYYEAQTVRQAHTKALKERDILNKHNNIKDAFWVVEYIEEVEEKEPRKSFWAKLKFW